MGPLMDTPFSGPRRNPRGSVSVAHSAESALLLRLYLAATPAARLRRRWNDVGNARVVHLFIQRGKFLVGDFFDLRRRDRKSTRLNSSHLVISYAVFCLKKKKLIS